MFRTTTMKLVEMMILKQDIDRVLEYLGTDVNFQIQNKAEYSIDSVTNPHREMLEKLQFCRNYLGIADADTYSLITSLPSVTDVEEAGTFIAKVDELREQEQTLSDLQKRVSSAYDEARAFANLKVAYNELENLTFLSFRIGKIDPSILDELKSSIGDRGVIIPLGEDQSRILAASSKKGRFVLDTELKAFGFVQLEVPTDFKGVPDDVLEGLRKQTEDASSQMNTVTAKRVAFAETHVSVLIRLLQTFSLGSQVQKVRETLEATQLVYRVMGWIAAEDSNSIMRGLDELTEGRVAIRVYTPNEVPSIQNGKEKVPVQYKHGPFVKSFERMVFSYGSPLYGTIDPTPIVAFFFTLLFGIMFGDVGQGIVFFLFGLILIFSKIKFFQKWRQFGPIFIAIGCSSTIMGLITGEFFANNQVLHPFSRWVTGLFGESRDVIFELMPSREALDKLIVFFGFTLVVGFCINSIGLIINIINQFLLGKPAKAIFSKTGLCGAFFFWYVVFAVVRIGFTGTSIQWFDIVGVAVPLFGLFFAEPFSRLIEGHRPIFENGLFAAVIEGIVEILEVVSTNISNSVSFLRVGAFALSHAVLSFIIFKMTDMVGGSFSAGGIIIGIFGNVVIIVLEGLIVTIQVIRLQYYEFFSKFFTETGKEFKPFRFKYKEN